MARKASEAAARKGITMMNDAMTRRDVEIEEKMKPIRARWSREVAQALSARDRSGGGKAMMNEIDTTGKVTTPEINATERDAAIKLAVKQLANEWRYQPSEHKRRRIEARVAELMDEHAPLCAGDKSLTPLDPPDDLQLAHLRARLRPLRMTAGRFRTLLGLPSTRMERELRQSKLREVAAEIERVERVIEKLEAAREPMAEER